MILNIKFLLCILLLCLLPKAIVVARTVDDDIATIRQRVLEFILWPPTQNISFIVQDTLNYSQTLNSSCYWPDIYYADTAVANWKTYNHLLRITTMLQAITVNGSPIKNDPKILSQVHCALNVWLTRDWKNNNWWYPMIGVPLEVTGHLLMLGSNATSEEFEKITNISYRANWWDRFNPYAVGANLVWMIQIQLYRSLATDNITGVEQGFSRMWQDIAISNTTAQDIQPDWSYHFHDGQLHSGSYGQIWARSILLFLQCSQNTQYQPDNDRLTLFGNYFINGNAWMIMTQEWDWHVLGRAISIPDDIFNSGFNADWIRLLAKLIKSSELRAELINFADRLDNNTRHQPLIGNRHFFLSDYQVHRRLNWIFTIKLQSNRTIPAECINGQNLKDEHEGQGSLNLFRTGYNDYDYIFPLLDWQAINGITVEHDIPIGPCINGRFLLNFTSMVGGVSDEQYGLAFMDTKTYNLTAQRSWHFYDDGVIALATNLTLTTRNIAWTTLASRLLSTGQVSVSFFNSTIITLADGNYTFPYSTNNKSNVQWMHLGDSNIGYILPLEQRYDSIGVQLGNKTGNFDTIGPSNVQVSARTVILFINHGQGTYTTDYNYMIVPNVTLESMPGLIKKYTEEQVFSCISTDKNLHGTVWPTLKRASFISWTNVPRTLSCHSPTFNLNITLSNAGAFLFSETETDFTITASHPVLTSGYLNVIVNRIGSGEGCSASSDADATITTNVTLTLPSIPSQLGASVNVTCKK